MMEVWLAGLLPVAAGAWFFGVHALLVTAVSVAAAVTAEYLCRKVMSRPSTIGDSSAVVTGLLLSLCLPPAVPLWAPAIGGACAIVIGKQVFGGLGQNIFNPAHIGRAILLASFPVQMTAWTAPAGVVDGVSMATPLALMKAGAMDRLPSLVQMLTGQISGSLGETSALAILAGGIFLIVRKHIDWRIPASYLGAVLVLTGIYGGVRGYGLLYPVYQLLSGGLLLGAFFMATDWVTSPVTRRGRVVFGLGLGLLTCLIRFFGGLAEGVCYSILLMNILTPLIDRYTKGRIYGRGSRA
jgi:electron transport complex protein RnfD